MRKIININQEWKFIKQDEVQAMDQVYKMRTGKLFMYPTHGTQLTAQMVLIFIKGLVGIEKSLL